MSQQPVYEFNGIKTLPIYLARARLNESLESFSSAMATFLFADPDYPVTSFDRKEWTEKLASDPKAAQQLAADWTAHHGRFGYFIEFKDDATRERIRSLSTHTELLSTLCDSRLGLDPTSLWNAFDSIHPIEVVQSEYRADPDREAKYADYAERLRNAWEQHGAHLHPVIRLLQRIERQIELKSSIWAASPHVMVEPASIAATEMPALRVFYSYSHLDEELLGQLKAHLSSMRKRGSIVDWYDRRITGGSEWESEIDDHLEAADIILLLVSSDFMNSDYCFGRELKRAMERHEEKAARVVPVILRPCDWNGSPFGILQGFPRDMRAVTSWQNIDEALTDVAKGIRAVVEEMRTGCR